MRSSSSAIWITTGSAAIAIAGCIWFLNSDRSEMSTPVNASEKGSREQVFSPPVSIAETKPEATHTSSPPETLEPLVSGVNEREDPSAARPPQLVVTSGVLLWEKQIADVANAQRSPADKARAIFAMLPTLPAEALETATRESIERVSNVNYAAVALPILINPQTNGRVLSVLFEDLLDRPQAIALPALLDVAQNEKHPFAQPAKEDLELLLQTNHGRDWSKWLAAIQQQVLAAPVAP